MVPNYRCFQNSWDRLAKGSATFVLIEKEKRENYALMDQSPGKYIFRGCSRMSFEG